jgi:hypothetical protein
MADLETTAGKPKDPDVGLPKGELCLQPAACGLIAQIDDSVPLIVCFKLGWW